MPTARQNLIDLGLQLPDLFTPIATYMPFKRAGDAVYLSGQGPRRPDGTYFRGTIGRDWTAEQAYEHAKFTGLALLAVAEQITANLDEIEVLKVFGLVNAVPEFADHPSVIDGCSDLFVAVLGERGRHARSAVGMGSLPNDMTVEIEAVVRIVQ